MPVERIASLSRNLVELPAATAEEIKRAYVDTLAVLCAGWEEPATQAVRRAYPRIGAPWDTAERADAEAAALVWGTAAHALDYDDVHMTSVTHPSAVLIPAIEAAARSSPGLRDRRATAFALGLAVNVGLGSAIGFAHYAKGWHATSTIGAVAAGAAVAHLFGLEGSAFRSALAIAAAQAGGLQRNFGTMAKPLQAGLAAQAGVRAARLAMADLEGASDVLSGDNGFIAVFEGTADAELALDVEEAVAGLSRKLFACCYLAHRPVAAAIHLHGQGASSLLSDPQTHVEVEVPPGCLKALTIDIPETGAEAKFSGKYTVAHALLTGQLGLTAFTRQGIGRSDIIDLARRVSLKETGGDAGVGIDRGHVTVSLVRAGAASASASVEHYPGSPAAPITQAQLEGKLADCVAIGAPGQHGLAAQIRSMARRFAGSA
ncbi:MAG: MmgE/PrpD family protein [Mesorhizobium sp.]